MKKLLTLAALLAMLAPVSARAQASRWKYIPGSGALVKALYVDTTTITKEPGSSWLVWERTVPRGGGSYLYQYRVTCAARTIAWVQGVEYHNGVNSRPQYDTTPHEPAPETVDESLFRFVCGAK